MKNTSYDVIAYERRGPLGDMFVPSVVTIAPVPQAVRRTPVFAIAALLIIAVPTFMLPGGTLSFFNDNEQSSGNTFGAGPLDISISADHVTATIFIDKPGEVFVFTPSAVANSLPFRYKVSGQASGNAFFCPELDAVGSAPLNYVGGAASLTTADTDSLAPWSLTLSLANPAPGVIDGQICILDLTFEAYQVGGAVGTEYHDTEHVILTLTADPPVISESASFTITTFVSEETPPPPPADEKPAEEPSEPKVTEPEAALPEVVEPEPTEPEQVVEEPPPPPTPPVDEVITPPEIIPEVPIE